MKTSVVMCTYNGEQYIYEQLNSIHEQTVKPDEVIIQDDGSTDNTTKIIKKYIKDNNLLESWHLKINEKNLGWKQNFMDAIKKSTGDLIFLSDQDDIWDSNKIKIMTNICSKSGNIELLVSRHEPFDSGTGEKVEIYQPSFGKHILSIVRFDGAFAECRRPGCTYAVSSKLKQYIDGIWEPDWPHDQFFWCVAIARGTLYSYNAPLVRFRRHEGTNTPSNEKESERRADIIKKDQIIAEALLENSDKLGIPREYWRIMRKSAIIYRRREIAIRNKKVFKLLPLVFRMKYYTRPKAWLGDIVAALR
ncbi:glycosyltransferase [Butyrivibrio sp. AD3002]|uniref:glycosyltransferase n=1 Tax=Butyrivibrio sp. AD3002 TaxID=1280670 RepID=UPI0003B35D50|nr:glycosyltransferase [Butyrivibrio sp. AD3002]